MNEPRIGSVVRTQLGQVFQRHPGGWWNADPNPSNPSHYREEWTWWIIVRCFGEPTILFEPEDPEPPVGSIVAGLWDGVVPSAAYRVGKMWEITGGDYKFNWKTLVERMTNYTIVREGFGK